MMNNISKTGHKLRSRAGRRGFTLIEMLVAIAVFSVLIAAASDIFMMASRAQRKIFDLQSMQASSRFTLDAIVREVRTGTIDYGYYASREPSLKTPERVLALIDSEETPIKFYESDELTEAYCGDALNTPCLLVEVGDYDPAPLNPRGIKVHAVNFFITPEVDPMAFDLTIPGYASDVQPIVTMVMSLESVGRKSGERTYLDVQATATSRKYVR